MLAVPESFPPQNRDHSLTGSYIYTAQARMRTYSDYEVTHHEAAAEMQRPFALHWRTDSLTAKSCQADSM